MDAPPPPGARAQPSAPGFPYRSRSPMLKLARWSTTHRLYVVIGWIVLIAVVNVLAQSAGTEYSNNFTLPNSDSQRAADLLQHSFPAQAGDRDQLVFRIASGTRPRPRRARAHERDLRASRTAAPRLRRDQPLRRARPPARRSPPTARSRSRRWCSTKKPTCCPRAPPNASSTVAEAARRGRACRSSSAARRSRPPSRKASACRPPSA